MKDKDRFNRKNLEFYLPETFKGLTKKYILNCIFNESIQSKWIPEEGDLIVGETGNVFVVSGKNCLHESLGGTLWFFGGNLCNRDGGCILKETLCFTMNESGKWFTYDEEGKIVEKQNCYHCSVSDFRFVPYPHEIDRF